MKRWRWPLMLRRVDGASMMPTLRHAQVVVLTPLLRVCVGNVVLFEHDGLEKLKRVAKIDDERVFVLGDNADASTDSREFGWLPRRAVRGRVVWPRTARRGR